MITRSGHFRYKGGISVANGFPRSEVMVQIRTTMTVTEEALPFQWRQDEPLKEALPTDLKTEEHFVPRDSRLIRLTGSHPLNAEPPSPLCYSSGFITPSNLHYVRTHGSPIDIADDELLDWSFSVEGLVEAPFTMTLREMIKEFPQYTSPFTLCCAGNRRMEQNVVKKGNGFNWHQNGVTKLTVGRCSSVGCDPESHSFFKGQVCVDGRR